MFKKITWLVLIIVLVSCKSAEIEIIKTSVEYGEIDVVAVEKNKTTTVVLFVPDDDTLSINEQVEFFKPLFDKQTSVYAFPKYAYQDPILKDNADNPTLRLELLVAAYQNLVVQNKIDSTMRVVVLGVGEGSLIAPHFYRIVHADELVLINPFYHSTKENLSLTFTETTDNSALLKQTMGFAQNQQWLTFLEDVSNNKHPDKSAGPRTYRYYINYWSYYPGKFYPKSTHPVKLLVFKGYIYTSQFDKEFISGLKGPGIVTKTLEGNIYSKFSFTELKKLDWF